MKPNNISIDNYYKNVPIVKFPNDEKIIILKIHLNIKKHPVKQCIKIEWRMDFEKASDCRYVFGVNEGIIEEIYELKNISISTNGTNRKILHVIPVNNKLRNKYVGNLIPIFFRQRRHTYPVRYNFYLKNGITIFYKY